MRFVIGRHFVYSCKRLETFTGFRVHVYEITGEAHH